ncbi:hypothetical protein CPB85DRAFT_1447424 [Mucidula mucida]|nr:hypothetical protein CPB85DRAFT_1447424 [Mucidula mucida]
MVGDEQPHAQLPTAALAYKRVTFVNEMDSTSGPLDLPTTALKMATWRPTLEGGWYYLGQDASSYYTWPPSIPGKKPPSGVIVHSLEEDALKDVTSWE